MKTRNNKELIYELLDISPMSEVELGYLIDLVKEFDILNEVKRYFQAFSPKYYCDNSVQSLSSFYKEGLISEIIWKFISETIRYKLNIKNKNIIEVVSNDLYQDFLDNGVESVFSKFFISNNLENLSKEEKLELFYQETKEKFKAIEEYI